MAFYILSALFIDNFVIIFVVTVLLAALDFWVVKNVSGRILVGLRWWNEIDDLGESVWKFECLDQEVGIPCFEHELSKNRFQILYTCMNESRVCVFSSVVIGSDEQERFMAFLVDPLHFGKKFYRSVLACSDSSVFP